MPIRIRQILLVLIATLLLLSNVQAQKTLRWGADPSGGAPYVYTDPANPDRYIGYEKEMVDALANAMSRKPEFVPSDWETLVSALQRNSFDVIVNGLEPTGDRAQQIAFSKPLLHFSTPIDSPP
jgi:polar amino acid transport system substrate-binding protein